VGSDLVQTLLAGCRTISIPVPGNWLQNDKQPLSESNESETTARERTQAVTPDHLESRRPHIGGLVPRVLAFGGAFGGGLVRRLHDNVETGRATRAGIGANQRNFKALQSAHGFPPVVEQNQINLLVRQILSSFHALFLDAVNC
jgi:hypothetical protein